MKKLANLLIIPLALACLITTASAQAPFIVESRLGGLNFDKYTDAGFANSSGNVTAPGATATIGSRYSGTTVYFGPSRYAQYSFIPSVSGTYQIDLAWASSAGQKFTAVNLYTGSATGGTIPDQWGNTGGPQGILYSGTMDMLYRGVGVWNNFTSWNLQAGTTYKVGIYGGYKSQTTDPLDPTSNRVISGAAKFTLVPEPSSLAFALLGGFGLFFARMRRL